MYCGMIMIIILGRFVLVYLFIGQEHGIFIDILICIYGEISKYIYLCPLMIIRLNLHTYVSHSLYEHICMCMCVSAVFD